MSVFQIKYNYINDWQITPGNKNHIEQKMNYYAAQQTQSPQNAIKVADMTDNKFRFRQMLLNSYHKYRLCIIYTFIYHQPTCLGDLQTVVNVYNM